MRCAQDQHTLPYRIPVAYPRGNELRVQISDLESPLALPTELCFHLMQCFSENGLPSTTEAFPGDLLETQVLGPSCRPAASVLGVESSMLFQMLLKLGKLVLSSIHGQVCSLVQGFRASRCVKAFPRKSGRGSPEEVLSRGCH